MYNKNFALLLTILSFIPFLGFIIFGIFTLPYLYLIPKKEIKENLEGILVGQIIVGVIAYCFFIL